MQKFNTLNNFNILRLALAILVFFAHWNILTSQKLSNPLFHLSGYAVDMFFIVSGFLVFWSYDRDQNKKHFYIKRFFRIFPLYAFLIVFQTLFFICFSDGNIKDIIKYFVVNIFFLNFLSPSVGTIFSGLEVNAINGSLWTLKNEVVFYALVPFIFVLFRKWGVWAFVVLYISSVFYMVGSDYFGFEKLLVQFPAQLRLFVIGILLYESFEKLKKLKNKSKIIMALGSLFLIIMFDENKYFKFIIYPFLLGFIMIWLAYSVKHINISFDFSYSFYIFHFPVIQLFVYFGKNPINPIVSFVIIFSIILVLSYLSEKYIEKRFIKIGHVIIRRLSNDTN